MAKQKETKKFEFSKVGSIMDNIAKTIPIEIERDIKEKTFVSTGCYLLDAAISARLIGGGFQSGRIFGLVGESGSGKSFIAYSASRSAQKAGYSVIYIDTENSIDLEGMMNFGIDISKEKLLLIRTNKVEEVNITLTQLLDKLKTDKMDGYENPKFLIVLDSIGMMSSNKEKEDLLKGDIKQDMTRAKSLNAMFRSISSDLGNLDIPLICCNHSYKTLDLFPTEVGRGGTGLVYSSSVLGFLSKSKLKSEDFDDMDLGANGITVLFKCQKNRLAKPKKIRFDISFTNGLNPYSGLDAFCRPEYYDKIGIAKGKEEVDKETGELIFKPGGNRWYVRHLGKAVSTKQLLSSMVFTQQVLESMAPIVNDYFKFKSIEEMEETESKFDQLMSDDETNGFTDASDANDIFE